MIYCKKVKQVRMITLEFKKSFFSKKKIRSFLGRLGIALVALSLVTVLILWDSGIIDLPLLVRSERREPLTETMEETKTEVIESIDYSAFAERLLSSVYSASNIVDFSSLHSTEKFDSKTMSIVKNALIGDDYETAYGFLLKNEGNTEKCFSLPSLTQIQKSEDYLFTGLLNHSGEAVFQKKDDKSYFVWNNDEQAFVAADYDPKKDNRGVEYTIPAAYGAENENSTLIYENGLFGYKGSFKDGRKTKEFSVDATYPTAYRYSEGFAVMADAEGKITIRNERGEVVFDHLTLLMTEKTGEEALGFHYFDHGLLRVVIAVSDENGVIKSKRESIINIYGEEVSLPQGYHAVSYLEGIFVVTNGDKFGYVSSDGAWITSPIYYDAAPFSGGIAVITNEDGKKGLIDSTGKTVLEPAFDGISQFSNGFSVLYSKEHGWYLLTTVKGIYPPPGEEPPTSSSEPHTKITITRGPQNSFHYEEDEIIVLPPVLSTPSRTTHPEYTTKPAQ